MEKTAGTLLDSHTDDCENDFSICACCGKRFYEYTQAEDEEICSKCAEELRS